MQTTNIYYGSNPTFGWGILEPELEPLAKSIKDIKTDIQEMLMLCPVFMSSMQGMYVLKSPCDIVVERDKESGYLKSFFKTGEPCSKEKTFKSKDVAQIFEGFFYPMADKPCTIEIYPPFYHSNKLFGFAGKYEIDSWYRSVHVATHFPYEDLIIFEGEPIMYVKFTPKKGKIKLHKSLIPLEAAHLLDGPMKNKMIMNDKPMKYLYNLMKSSKHDKKIIQLIKEYNKNL